MHFDRTLLASFETSMHTHQWQLLLAYSACTPVPLQSFSFPSHLFPSVFMLVGTRHSIDSCWVNTEVEGNG